MVDIAVYSLAVQVLLINYLAANTFSFSVSMVANYFWSREWAFNKKEHNLRRDFLLYSLIGLTGLLLSNLLLYILIDLGIMEFFLPASSNALIITSAKIATIFIVFIWNFAARKKLIFT